MEVYFIKTKDNLSLIKIGMSKDVPSRLANLQTGCPAQLELLHSIQCNSVKAAATIETSLHKLFAYCKTRGEWFSPSKPLRDFISNMKSGMMYTEAKEKAWNSSKHLRLKKKIGQNVKRVITPRES